MFVPPSVRLGLLRAPSSRPVPPTFAGRTSFPPPCLFFQGIGGVTCPPPAGPRAPALPLYRGAAGRQVPGGFRQVRKPSFGEVGGRSPVGVPANSGENRDRDIDPFPFSRHAVKVFCTGLFSQLADSHRAALVYEPLFSRVPVKSFRSRFLDFARYATQHPKRSFLLPGSESLSRFAST